MGLGTQTGTRCWGFLLRGGSIAGVDQLQKILRRVSHNGTRSCFALKMDVQRFFDSVDHDLLKSLLRLGLPLGNVTSQIFANVYLHPLDHFVKHTLRQKYYLRYCDDFMIVAHEKSQLTALMEPISDFLAQQLRLTLHPKKIILSNMHQGIDFLGYILFLHHRLLRTSTRRRMQRRLKTKYTAYLQQQIDPTHMDQSLQSYLGILSHANAYHLSQNLKNTYWIRAPD
jgi:RNA-directed DNA polymerase